MAQFVQIGKIGFNLDHIISVEFNEDEKHSTYVRTTAFNGVYLLEGPDAEAFRSWWDYKADAYKVG